MDSTIHDPFKELPEYARKTIISLLCEKIAFIQVKIDYYRLTDEEISEYNEQLKDCTKLLYMMI